LKTAISKIENKSCKGSSMPKLEKVLCKNKVEEIKHLIEELLTPEIKEVFSYFLSLEGKKSNAKKLALRNTIEVLKVNSKELLTVDLTKYEKVKKENQLEKYYSNLNKRPPEYPISSKKSIRSISTNMRD
jgi:hypothetical protein